MAWERPIGHEDPMNAWENEEYAYDEDLGTVATSVPLPMGIWTGYLVFTWPQFIAQKLVGRVNCPTANYSFEVDGWDGTAWSRMMTVVNTRGPRDINLGLSPVARSKIRIRFQHLGAGWQRGELNDIRIDRTCRGPLVAICGFLSQARGFFNDLADDIEDWAIVGDALAGPFRALSGLFNTASNTCCVASSTLQDILDEIEGGFTWAGFLTLLQDYAPTLYYLIVDPIGEVLYLIGQAFDIDPWHLRSLDTLVKYVLQTYLPSLYQFWLDPSGWFESLLQERFPVLYYLIVDPAGEVLYLIGQAFDLTPYEAQSPEFIVKALFERYFPELYLIWRDPDGWLLARLGPILDAILEEFKDLLELSWDKLLDLYEDAFEAISARLYSLVERTVRFFWEGTW